MEEDLGSDEFPPGFPAELAAAAFVAGADAAWQPPAASAAIQWLSVHGYAVLGTEVWIPRNGKIQSVPYFQSVDRLDHERWDLFAARAATETLAYLRKFGDDFAKKGDVYINVNWVDEAEFEKL